MSILVNRRALLAALASSCAGPLGAQTPATRRLVVGLPAGTAIDVLSRRLADLWAEHFQLGCEVENAPGGAGVLAASRVLQAPPDGKTLLLGNSGLFSTAPVMMKDTLKFDPETEFVPLAVLVKAPFFLVTSSEHGIPRLPQLRGAGPTHFAVDTLYGANHLASSLLFQRLGVPAQVVGYTQLSQMLTDVASGRIPYAATSWNNLRALVGQNRLRALCVLSASRAPFAPGIPSLGEFGLEACAQEGWLGIFHRREVAPESVQPCAQALRQLFASRPPLLDVGEYGYLNAYLDGQQAASFVRHDIARHRGLLRQLSLL